MINPLDVAKEIKAMADVLTNGPVSFTSTNEVAANFAMDAIDAATEIWEKVYAINHCPNCDMEEDEAWKLGNPEHDPENN